MIFKIETSIQTVLSKLDILEELRQEIRGESHRTLQITFPENDSRFSATQEEGDDPPTGILTTGENEPIKIICMPIQDNLMRYGEKGLRHALIYERLSANTLVHPFYGIAKRFGRSWEVMKDMWDFSSLGSAINARTPPETILARLEIAQNIAKTVAYLHSVDVLVKRLSDTTVLLSVDSNGVVTPYLTNLEIARLVST